MKRILILIIIGVSLFKCTSKKPEKTELKSNVEFNQALADELKRMAEVDQIAAWNRPTEKYKNLPPEAWTAFKDSVYTTHQKRLKEILDQHGFVGFDLAGKEGSLHFWLMTQHSDLNPEFQKEVLEKMKIEVDKGNASPSNYGLLVDRVNINTGKPQIYGTQVDYNFEIAQAFPKNLADPANVNKRRQSIGMEPLEEYLNQMTLMNFEMNKEFYMEKGITEPKLYKIE